MYVFIFMYTYVRTRAGAHVRARMHTKTREQVCTPRRDGRRGQWSGNIGGGHDPEIPLRRDKSSFKMCVSQNLPLPLFRFLTWIFFGPGGGVI